MSRIAVVIWMRCLICKEKFIGIPFMPDTPGAEPVELVPPETDEIKDFICEDCQEEKTK